MQIRSYSVRSRETARPSGWFLTGTLGLAALLLIGAWTAGVAGRPGQPGSGSSLSFHDSQPARIDGVSSIAVAIQESPEESAIARAERLSIEVSEETVVSVANVTEPEVSPPAGVEPAPAPVDPPAAPAVAAQERIVLAADSVRWDAVTRSQIEQAIALLPASIRAQLGNPAYGPIVINVNTEGRTSSGKQPYGGAANFFSTNESTNELVLYPQQGVITVLHELGHAYNLRRTPAGSYAQVLLDSEMISFMRAANWKVLTPSTEIASMRDIRQVRLVFDGPSIWSSLSHNDVLEDFATSFAYYFAAPEVLRDLSPARYEWFAANLGS